MARPLRFHAPGSVTHIMSRGLDGKEIFLETADREELMHRLGALLQRTGFRCVTWCLMDNHYHLVLRATDQPPAELMRPLNGGYARWLNQKYGRSGYVFQDRYKSLVCQNMDYAVELIRYVHLNPLRAGIVRNMDALGRYRWCGHRAVLGDKQGCSWQATDEVLKHFGRSREVAREKYLEFLKQRVKDDADGDELPKDSWSAHRIFATDQEEDRTGGGRIPGLIGDPSFVQKVLADWDATRENRYTLLGKGWDLDRLMKQVALHFGLDREDLLHRARNVDKSTARSVLAHLAYRELGIPLTRIAGVLGISGPCTSISARRGSEACKRLGITISSLGKKSHRRS